MDNKDMVVCRSLPVHLWNLKELSKERVIDTPSVRSKSSNTIVFPNKLNKPCSKILSKW